MSLSNASSRQTTSTSSSLVYRQCTQGGDGSGHGYPQRGTLQLELVACPDADPRSPLLSTGPTLLPLHNSRQSAHPVCPHAPALGREALLTACLSPSSTTMRMSSPRAGCGPVSIPPPDSSQSHLRPPNSMSSWPTDPKLARAAASSSIPSMSG